MKFSVGWIDGGNNASAEERATLCHLKILVGEENACSYWDDKEGRPYGWVTVPADKITIGVARVFERRRPPRGPGGKRS